MNVERAQDLIGTPVFDKDGNRVGRVGNVYVDDDTNQPEWVTVRVGLLGMKETFVPLDGAKAEENRLELGVAKERVRNAPQIDAENGHLSDSEGHDLYRYYGLERSIQVDEDDLT